MIGIKIVWVRCVFSAVTGVVLLFAFTGWAGASVQEPLPTKVGEIFMIDDFDSKVTENDLGFNFTGGNAGELNIPGGTNFLTLALPADADGGNGASLEVGFDFSGGPAEAAAGFFTILGGLSDTLVSLDGSGVEPAASTMFPGYFLNFNDIYGDSLAFPDHSVEQLSFEGRLKTGSGNVNVKVELKDESGFDVFGRQTFSSETWTNFTMSRANFTNSVAGAGNPAGFNWTEVTSLSFIVERVNVGDGVANPDTGGFVIDELRLVDSNGSYPDLAAADDGFGGLQPQYQDAFLDLVGALSFQYFLDFASTDPRTGGLIQDRSNFADLLTIGGAGFQLSAYVIGAERGYISRENAAQRTRDVLFALKNQPQGTGKVGTIGQKGYFYHFLGIDGLRKQNFDFNGTAGDESLNTVELSLIDTALAMGGVVTAGQYFFGSDPVEAEIRMLADEIYRRIDWNFMVSEVGTVREIAGGKQQFLRAWKPNETRSDGGEFGRYLLDDDAGDGQYTSGDNCGTEVPATLDIFTDEALLAAILSMGAPDPGKRLGREVWDDLVRVDGSNSTLPFVKSFPGTLFTYFFFANWADTERLGPENTVLPKAEPQINWFANTQSAIDAVRDHTTTNPAGRATFAAGFSGLTAAEGPFDVYFPEGAPTASRSLFGGAEGLDAAIDLEGEDATGDGSNSSRGNASGGQTRLLLSGQSANLAFNSTFGVPANVFVRYSNDGPAGPHEVVGLAIDGTSIGNFTVIDTRMGGAPGSGWDTFCTANFQDTLKLTPGPHTLTISVSSGDAFGVEIDSVLIAPLRSIENGTVAPYGVGMAVKHRTADSVAELFKIARHDLDGNGMPELLHPRFGFADAFNLDIADAVIPGVQDGSNPDILRTAGPWANFTGFAIDHGPMLIMISNLLDDDLVPSMFMSHPEIQEAFATIFDFDRHSDLSSRATALRIDGGTATVDGSLTPGDVDFLRFEVTADRAVTISSSGGIDPVGRLFTEKMTLLNDPVADDNAAGVGFNFEISTALPAGVYFLEVRGSDDAQTGDYAVTVHEGGVVVFTYQPDHEIGSVAATLKGNGIYNLTGAGQTLVRTSRRARRVEALVAVENDGDGPDTFMIVGGKGNRLFGASFFSPPGGDNITAEILVGTYSSVEVVAGATAAQIKVIVNPRRSQIGKRVVRQGRESINWLKRNFSIPVTGTSKADTAARDRVIFRVRTR